MDGRYVTHIHHVSHLRNMRETSRIIANPRIISESCETPRNIAKHARNMRGTCVIPCVNLAKLRETCAQLQDELHAIPPDKLGHSTTDIP